MPTGSTKTLRTVAAYLLQADPDMTVSRMSIFLYLAGKKDVLVRDIVRATGMNQSTIARTLALLSDKPQRGKRDGLRWVELTPDPEDPRRSFINLTAKGERVLADLEEMMG